MSKFPWGRVIETFEVRLDKITHIITKYHPHKRNGSTITREIDTDTVLYHSEEISTSSPSLEVLYLSLIANNNIGLNQHNLVSGIVRALCIEEVQS